MDKPIQVEHRAGVPIGNAVSTPVTFHDNLTWFDAIPGERLCLRVPSSEVGGRYAILENIAQPGTATPMHFHAEDEIFHVLEGVVTFSVDGRIFNAPAGTMVPISAQVPHAWKNRTSEAIRMSSFFSPGTVDELFLRLGSVAPEELQALASTYGTYIVGPPIAD